MKKIMMTLMMIAVCWMFGGCETMQVNERMFVQMMGLGEENGIYELSVQVCSPSGKSEDPQPEYEFLTGRGRSFYEAADAICRETGRELYFGHCMMIVADGNVIRDKEKLKTLSGERISIGSKVYYSADPAKSVGVYDDGKLTGADRLAAIAEQYEKDGLAKSVTLRDVMAAAENGKKSVVPSADRKINGTAIVSRSGDAVFLTLSESAAYNLLMGTEGVKISVLGADVKVKSAEMDVYHRTGQGYEISIRAECLMDEIGATADITDYEKETERIIAASAEHILARAFSEGFADTIINAAHRGDGRSISVSAKVSIVTEDEI